MFYKRFITLFFLLPLLITTIIFSINYIVDPFNLTKYNILNIKHKFARDDRKEKIGRVKKIPYIDNLILGSSRSLTLSPKLLSEFLGGYSYNFGVGGGNLYEALGLLLYLKSKNKLPKNILLTLDFSGFIESKPHPSFLQIKELNFLNNSMAKKNILTKFLSIDSVRASFKTLKAHLQHKMPNSFFYENGLISMSKEPFLFDQEKMENLAITYYKYVYKASNYKISNKKFDYLKKFVDICKKEKINLKVLLTPVHPYQLSLVNSNKTLNKKLQSVKHRIRSITPFIDRMQKTSINVDQYFADSVHYTHEYGNIILQSIYERRK